MVVVVPWLGLVLRKPIHMFGKASELSARSKINFVNKYWPKIVAFFKQLQTNVVSVSQNFNLPITHSLYFPSNDLLTNTVV